MISKYHPLLEMETPWILKRLLEDPEDYVSSIRRYAGGLTLLVVYGYQVKSNDDPFLLLANQCVDILANEISSGGGIWPVDVFPACRFHFWGSRTTLLTSPPIRRFHLNCIVQNLPEWAPGAGFLKKARVWRAKMIEFVDKPYEFVKESVVWRRPTPSSHCFKG